MYIKKIYLYITKDNIILKM